MSSLRVKRRTELPENAASVFLRNAGTDLHRLRCATPHNIKPGCLVSKDLIKATNTHPEYVILIAFPRQHWLRERASMLLCTYIACLIIAYTSLRKARLWQWASDSAAIRVIVLYGH
jgi:hypothetical protein